jgi:LmbE family N-acetylglucosaminyl deacetylase
MNALNLESCQTGLVLAPHTDDGEFGCGGTIAKLVDMGVKIQYVAFSNCEKSLPKDMPPDLLVKELMHATKKLGIPPDHVIVKNFEVRYFERDRQKILETLVQLERRIHPQLVLLPSPNDLHQDHHTIAMEGLRAFKRSSTILGYEMPWNNLTFSTTAFISLSGEHIQRKISALKCYKSQKSRFYASADFVRSLAVARGAQIGKKYAETFEVLRWIID